MVRGVAVEKAAGHGGNRVHGHVGLRSQTDHHQQVAGDSAQGGGGDVVLSPPPPLSIQHLPGQWVLLHEQTDKQLEHIGQGQPAAEQEQPLQGGEQQIVLPRQGDVLHNALVEEGLAHIAVEGGHPRQAEHGQPHEQGKEGLSPAEAPDLIEVKGVGGQVDDPRQGKEHHFNEGVVQDVQDGAVHRQGIVLPQQAHHGRPHQNEADLGDGGAGQGTLQVDGAHRQHRPQHHGHRPDGGQQQPPGPVVQEDGGGQHQNAIHPRLDNDAGEHRRGWGGGRRVCGGQPDVQRKGPRLGPEAHQHQQGTRPQQRPVLHRRCGRPHLVQVQGAQLSVEEKQPCQRRQTADHRHRQIGLPRLQGLILLGLNHQDEGGEGHDLKKHKSGEQVRRQEHPHSGP